MKTIDLAKKLNITHSNISQWKSKNKIPDRRIRQIAKIIKVTSDELFDDNSLLFDRLNSTSDKTPTQ